MIYLDIENKKEKNKINQVISNLSYKDVIIIDSIAKVNNYYNAYKDIIVFNKKKNKLDKSLYFNEKVYICNQIDELPLILDSINKKRNYKRNKNLIIESTILILLIVILIISIILVQQIEENNNTKKVNANEQVEINQEITDYQKENIVFYGDSITEMYPLDEFFSDYPVVNAGHGGYLTHRLLEEIDEKLLVYNPTKVFLLMGTNDLGYSDLTDEEIVSNIKEIVKRIKRDRKYTKIYIESIYPVNETIEIDRNVLHIRRNNRIRHINSLLEKYCKEEKITYINLYDVLKEDDESINDDYTIEGLHINEEGYKVITEQLIKYIKEK